MIVATGPVHPVAVEVLGPIEVAENWRSLLPDAEALIVRGDASVGQRELASAPRLRVIGRSGVGVDRVDMAATAARGIPVAVSYTHLTLPTTPYV